MTSQPIMPQPIMPQPPMQQPPMQQHLMQQPPMQQPPMQQPPMPQIMPHPLAMSQHVTMPGNYPALAFHSAPLDVTVGDKIRQQIISNIYIDFASLLGNDTSEGSTKTSLSYNEWQKAFMMYATVYAQQYPQEWPHMTKYADTIRELKAANAKWEFYDERFRRNRQRVPWPWQSLQMELWGKAMTIFYESNDESEEDIPRTRQKIGQVNKGHERWSEKPAHNQQIRNRSTGLC